ncbi:unnamed protein product [Nesidiocoris tenuis]|uniref:Retroviral polymerase SH3-like domain-containing protein n=1 Tax=Nesidiocoris tenuis TaxID=355587 RepID=A0A6H5H748_9HEMI|nr:unnamed protein product [Nesidiocoris tenuis]
MKNDDTHDVPGIMRSVNFKTPFEMFTGRRPQINYIKRFGCEAYVFDPKAKSKFQPRSRLGYLLECQETGYLIYMTDTKTLVRSKHVDFVESRVYGDRYGPDASVELESNLEFDRDRGAVLEAENPSVPISSTSTKWLGENSDCEFYEESEDNESEEALLAFLNTECNGKDEPEQYSDAMNSPDWEEWQKSVNDELDSHEACGTWKLIEKERLPQGATLIKARWRIDDQMMIPLVHLPTTYDFSGIANLNFLCLLYDMTENSEKWLYENDFTRLDAIEMIAETCRIKNIVCREDSDGEVGSIGNLVRHRCPNTVRKLSRSDQVKTWTCERRVEQGWNGGDGVRR